MSETLIAVIVDGSTGLTTERPLTANEIAERQAMQTESDSLKAEAEAKVAARESALAKLAALGLTADEVAAL
jgi:hypothetical protein